MLTHQGPRHAPQGQRHLVAPPEELAAREKAELEAQQGRARSWRRCAPSTCRSTTRRRRTSRASIKSAGRRARCSPSAAASAIDERTNTLLVQDTAERLADIRRLVSTLDIPVRQVLIEARIVIVNDDFSRELGVRAGFTRVSDDVKDLMAVSGSAQATDSIMGSALDNLASSGTAVPGRRAVRPGVRALQGQPAGREPGGPHRADAARLDDYLVDLELSAAQNEGRGEIMSTPRVITANQRRRSSSRASRSRTRNRPPRAARRRRSSRRRCCRSRSRRRSRRTTASSST